MSALDWRNRMPIAPALRHDNGMVLAVIGERAIVFPSEADARFFVEAYTDVPNLASQADTLRAQIDEGALNAALARIRVLESENRILSVQQGELEAQLADLAKVAATAVQRARILATVLKRKQP